MALAGVCATPFRAQFALSHGSSKCSYAERPAFFHRRSAFNQHSYSRRLPSKRPLCLAVSKLAEEGRASVHYSTAPRKEPWISAAEQTRPVVSFRKASFLLGLAVAASGLLRRHPAGTILAFALFVFQSKILPELLRLLSDQKQTRASIDTGKRQTAQRRPVGAETTAVELVKPRQTTEETLQPVIDAAKREVRQEVVAAGVVGRLERIMRILPVIQEAALASRDLAKQASGETAAALGVSTKVNAEVVGLKRQMAVSLDTLERNLQADLTDEINKGAFQVTAAVKESLENMEGRITNKVATSAEVLALHQRLDTVAQMVEDLSRTSGQLRTLPQQVEALQEQLSLRLSEPPETDQDFLNLQCTVESGMHRIVEEMREMRSFEAGLRTDVEHGFQKLESGRSVMDPELRESVRKMLDEGREVMEGVQHSAAKSAAACEEVKDLVVSQQSSRETGRTALNGTDRLLAESLAKILARVPALGGTAPQELAKEPHTAGLKTSKGSLSVDSRLEDDDVVDEPLLQAQRAFQSVYASPHESTAPVLEPRGRSETQEGNAPLLVGQSVLESDASQTDSGETSRDSFLTTSVSEQSSLAGATQRFEVPHEVEALTQSILSIVQNKLQDGVAPDKAFTGAIEEAPPGALEDVSWVFSPEPETGAESVPVQKDSRRGEAERFERGHAVTKGASSREPEFLNEGTSYEENARTEWGEGRLVDVNGDVFGWNGSSWREVREPFHEAWREEDAAFAEREALTELAVAMQAEDAFVWSDPSYSDKMSVGGTNGRQAAHWSKDDRDFVFGRSNEAEREGYGESASRRVSEREFEEGRTEREVEADELHDDRVTSNLRRQEVNGVGGSNEWEAKAFFSRSEEPFPFRPEPQSALAGWRTTQVPDLRGLTQLELERPPGGSVLDLRSEQDVERLTSADVTAAEQREREGGPVSAAMGSEWADEEIDEGWGYSQRRREGRTQGVNGPSPEAWDFGDEERSRGPGVRRASNDGRRPEGYGEGGREPWEDEGSGVNASREEYWAESPRTSRGRKASQWDEEFKGPRGEASQVKEEPYRTEVSKASGGWEEPLGVPDDALQRQYEENLSRGLRLLEEGRKGLNGRSEVLIADRMFSDAALAFEDALAADPDSRMALLQLGSAFLDHGEMKLRLAERIAASSEGRFASPEEEEWLQAIYDGGGDPSDVIAELREGCEELLKEAGSTFREAVARDSRDAEALTLWGLALCFRGQSVSDRGNEQGSGDMRRAADELFQSGVQKFEAALAVNPDLFTALLNWGFALRDRSRLRPITSVQRRKLLIEAVDIIAEVANAGRKAGGEALMARQELPVLESELEMVEEAVAASQAARERSPARTPPPVTDQRPRRSSADGWQDL